MRLLLRTSSVTDGRNIDVGDDLTDQDLVELYQPANEAGVRANMIASLDGSATGETQHSADLHTPADNLVFSLLRALSDVVIVGAGTVRDEKYGRVVVDPRWRGIRPDRSPRQAPTLAVVTNSGEVPSSLLTASPDAGELIVITCRSAYGAVANVRERLGEDAVILAGDDTVDLTSAVAQLRERDLGHILCEGGPRLLGAATSSGILSELCLTIAPTLVGGSGPRIAIGPDLRVHARPRLLIEDQGTLLGRWQLS